MVYSVYYLPTFTIKINHSCGFSYTMHMDPSQLLDPGLVLHHLKTRHAPHPQRCWMNSWQWHLEKSMKNERKFGIYHERWVKIWDLTISEYVYYIILYIFTWNLFKTSSISGLYRIFHKIPWRSSCWQPNLPRPTKELSEGLGDIAASGPTKGRSVKQRKNHGMKGWQL